MFERMHTSAVVAERLGIRVTTLRAWARAGLIPAGRTRGGAKYLWNDQQIKEIADMLADGEVAAEVEVCHA